jgi:hypothetical protein
MRPAAVQASLRSRRHDRWRQPRSPVHPARAESADPAERACSAGVSPADASPAPMPPDNSVSVNGAGHPAQRFHSRLASPLPRPTCHRRSWRGSPLHTPSGLRRSEDALRLTQPVRLRRSSLPPPAAAARVVLPARRFLRRSHADSLRLRGPSTTPQPAAPATAPGAPGASCTPSPEHGPWPRRQPSPAGHHRPRRWWSRLGSSTLFPHSRHGQAPDAPLAPAAIP